MVRREAPVRGAPDPSPSWRGTARAAGLAVQKRPEQLELAAALPRNASGKVLKHELRRRFSAGAKPSLV